MSKQVYCLYRVSTKGQVEKDDIPMQKQRCHEFAAQMGWEIAKEFSEKGVSGFKVSAKDRDAIQEIQKDAAMNKFDILLVFMFDCLGRKEDETPFVVEWFVKNGIEVWSAVEGQQKIENHVDKLMNYIRYWQASGESIKTSIRVKTRLAQIVQEGRFRGGSVPYGYRLVKKGRVGKKNRELYDIEIDPDEASVISRIFELADKYGYGGRKISSELKKEGLLNQRTGQPFHYSTIQNILRNITYVGIMRSGETKSDIFPELQIITPEQFGRIEKAREQRTIDYTTKMASVYQKTVILENGEEATVLRPPRDVPRKNVGQALLSGNVYCGHCGGRIFASTGRKSHHTTAGEVQERIPIYKCYNRTQHKELCDGPSTYRAQKVDAILEEILRDIFVKAKGVNEYDLIQAQLAETAEDYQQRIKNVKADLTKNLKELDKWENLMLDSIEGTCVFTPEQVKRRMDTVQETINDLTRQSHTLQVEAEQARIQTQEFKNQYERLLNWASIFDSASIEEKKMIASYVFKAVTISRDYKLQIEFNISEAQYLNGMEM